MIRIDLKTAIVDTKANWEKSYEVMPKGILIYESDTNKVKLTDGDHSYSELEYLGGECMGITSYTDLGNKPSINGVTIIGEKSLAELGIQAEGDYALKSELPTKVSELENDEGYLVEHQDISGKADVETVYTKDEIDSSVKTINTSIATKANSSDVYTKSEVNGKVETINEKIAEKADSEDVYTKAEIDSSVKAINEVVATKADADEVKTAVKTINEAIAEKADSETVEEELAKKVNATSYEADKATFALANEVNVELAEKAEKADVYTKAEVDAKVASVYRVKGSKATVAELSTEGNVEGDVYNVLADGSNYVWTESGWDKLSETVDLTPYLTKEDAEKELAEKAEKADVYTKAEADEKFLTEHQSLEEYALKSELPVVPEVVSAFVNDAGYLTEHQDISGKADVETVESVKAELAEVKTTVAELQESIKEMQATIRTLTALTSKDNQVVVESSDSALVLEYDEATVAQLDKIASAINSISTTADITTVGGELDSGTLNITAKDGE